MDDQPAPRAAASRPLLLACLLIPGLLLPLCGVTGALVYLTLGRLDPSLTEPPPPRARLTFVAGARVDAATLEQAAGVLRARLDRSGIDGAVEVLPEGRLGVEVSEDRLDEAIDLLLAGGDLSFKLVAQLEGEELAAEVARVRAAKEAGSFDPRTDPYDVAHDEGSGAWVLLENPGVAGYLVASVYPSTDSQGRPAIGFELSPEGKQLFAELTGANVGRDLGIVLDGELKSRPRILNRIEGSGVVQDDDGFSEEEVQRLVTVLSSGRLPVELDLEAAGE